MERPLARTALVLMLVGVIAAAPATKPAATKERSARERALVKQIQEADRALAADPQNAAAYQQRGAAHFRLGHIAESIADFDKYLELRPGEKPEHWQRGIALYYAGRYEDGAKQFELHRTVNPEDVENAAWHYLCVARAALAGGADAKQAVEKARAMLIPIKGDRRIPMMNVQALFAGKGTPEDVLAAAKAGKPGEEELKDRLFYAHLYLGLWHEAAGQADEAKKHIGLAANEYARDHYMGDVARVHAAVHAAAAGKKR
jgi:lipoprotein NlpI